MKQQTKVDKERIITLLLSGELPTGCIEEIEELFSDIKRFDFRPLINRIFDIGEDYSLNKSAADSGMLGRLNKRGRHRKNRKFLKRLLGEETPQEQKVILAEGDSWFEYPYFVTDIIDWIIRMTKNPVYSLAYGGDWISNILYSGDYIHELSLYLPDIFLISGGGNDLVGNNRIALLVKQRSIVDPTINDEDIPLIDRYLENGVAPEIAEKIVIGRKFLKKDFWDLLNVLRFQYFLIFKNIELSEKFDKMKIITQGYDYAIPSSNKSIFVSPLRMLTHNGRWLNIPLEIRGIRKPEEKEAIIAAMIYEFNEMLIDLGRKKKNVYHIDCRGFADKNCWLDELHLKSRYYKTVAKAYVACINSEDPEQKVFRVVDYQ